jgi:hypothetical protein
MPNDERGHTFRNQQDDLHAHRRGGSSNDSLDALTLTIALVVVIGVFVALMFALVVR